MAQTALILGGAVAAPVTLNIVGFTPAGVRAGSIAAWIQRRRGNVATGSLFATLQAAGTSPVLTGLVSGATVAGGIAVTHAAGFLLRR